MRYSICFYIEFYKRSAQKGFPLRSNLSDVVFISLGS